MVPRQVDRQKMFDFVLIIQSHFVDQDFVDLAGGAAVASNAGGPTKGAMSGEKKGDDAAFESSAFGAPTSPDPLPVQQRARAERERARERERGSEREKQRDAVR